MEIKRSGSQPSGRGPDDWFTGTVRIDPLFTAPDPARVSGASVTFEPGARTAWHTHTLAQTLYVSEGEGLVQARGEAILRIRAGDIVNVAGAEWHWHGAAPDHFMTHLSLAEGEVGWGEHVTDAEYHGH